MYYETEGAGEPLLLLHGGTGCQENWVHAGGDQFAREYTLIKPDARGHGRTTNPAGTITHRQCAFDTLALLDHLKIRKCRAIGLSMGGNTVTVLPGKVTLIRLRNNWVGNPSYPQAEINALADELSPVCREPGRNAARGR